VARSVRACLAAIAVAIPLAGCTTTQHEAQRVQLDSARQRAALERTRVTVANPAVTTSVAKVSAGGRTAFVVTVHNGERRAVTDLPISVGYERGGGASVYLNSSAGLNYFEAHLPAIAAGRSLTWIYTADKLVPTGAHPFARVGLKPSAPARLTEMDVHIGLSYAQPAGQRSLTVHLDNPTSVPQYQLQLYAYALRDGRYVAAGNTTVADLGAGSKQRVKLALTGTAASNLHVEAVPTILQ
jgi:hypothetical protein